jgi:DNA-binding transcriptional ArsR family regulator
MNDSLDDVERAFLAFSDKTRIRLIHLMSRGEVSVNYLCESLEISQPKVSRHLAYLRSMGVVNTRRDGKWIYYSLAEPKSRIGSQFFRDALSWIGSVIDERDEFMPPPVEGQAQTHQAPKISEEINIYGKAEILPERDEMEIYLL